LAKTIINFVVIYFRPLSAYQCCQRPHFQTVAFSWSDGSFLGFFTCSLNSELQFINRNGTSDLRGVRLIELTSKRVKINHDWQRKRKGQRERNNIIKFSSYLELSLWIFYTQFMLKGQCHESFDPQFFYIK
jgi:hypothetical protein